MKYIFLLAQWLVEYSKNILLLVIVLEIFEF